MTEQTAITISASAVGFVSAVFFCIGNVLNSAKKIEGQATPQWDFMESVARALAAQRAQYAVGALLLLVAFVLQVAAVLTSPTNAAPLPQCLHTWQYLVFSVLSLTGLISGFLSALIYKTTMRKIEHISKERIRKTKDDLKNHVHS